MLARLRFESMRWFKESDFGDEHLCILHIGLIEDGSGRRVSQKRDHRDFHPILNLDASLPHRRQLLPGDPDVFLLELFANADQSKAQAWPAVVGREGSDTKITPNFPELPSAHGDDFVRGSLPLDI